MYHYLDLCGDDFDALKLSLRSYSINVPGDVENLRAREASWDDLHRSRSEIKSAMGKLLKKLKEESGEAECRKVERSHDILMACYDHVDGEMDERKALGQTTPLTAEQRGIPNRGAGSCGAVAGSGGTDIDQRSGWTDKDGSEIRVLRPEDNFRDSVTGRYTGPRFGSILRALVTGARTDEEKRALAEGTDSAGGFTVPTPLASWYIDRLRANSVVIKAGARTVPMSSETLAIARLETDPTMAWRAENAAIGESNPTFAAVTLQAKSLAGMVKVSRELMADSVNVGEMLENAFMQAAALEFDRACLFGSGSSNQPEGLDVISGITEVSMGTNGAALADYDKLIDTIYELQLANAGDPTAMIWHPRTGRDLAKLVDGDGNPLRVPEMVAKVPKLATTSVEIDQTQGTATDASPVLMGDFRRMLIGLRNEIRIEVNPYLYQANHQLGFFCHMRGDVQLEHKASFAKLIGVVPAA